MTLIEWLNRPYGDGIILDRLAELIGVNGGRMIVNGWGYISYSGPFGRTGLDQHEAFQLLEFGGIVNGFLLATDGRELEEFKRLIQERIDKAEQSPIDP